MAKKSQRRNSSNAPTDREVDEAVSVIKRSYYADVKDLADSLRKEIDDGEIEDEDDLTERISEDVDGSARVIYTFQNKLGLLASDNEDAYVESHAELPTDGDSINWAALMAAAMEQDVRDELGDFDDLFEDDEDEDDED